MPRGTVERRSTRLHQQLTALQAQVASPDSISRRQVAEALEAVQASLQELEVAEAELSQQNEELCQVREELELERHRYQELFELAPLAYLVTDLGGRIVDANLAACDLLGSSIHALTGKPISALIQLEQRQALRNLVQRVRGPEEREVALLTAEGPRVVILTVQRDEDRHRSIPRLRWVLRDVTEQREFERALRSAEDQLRHSQKLEAVGRLAGGVAHSFNNLLAAIALHAELLLEARGSEVEQQRHALEIQNAGERAAALARQLLAFGRKQVLQPRPLDVGREIAAIIPMLRRLVGEDIEMETSLDPGTGWIHGDLGQLEQVILNLVVNARDAMPDGGRLRIAASRIDLRNPDVQLRNLDPGPYVEILVSDTGIGMDAEVRSRLFEPFFTTKDRDKGSGLGLATVYGIVQQSGGDVLVDSELGTGSTFLVYLPAVEAVHETAVPAPAASVDEPAGEVVLFVEDEANIREPAREVLEARGYTVLAAGDAAEALSTMREWDGPLDLLITDVVMPGMNGSQLADEVCRERPATRVLYISGYPEDAIARHGVLQADRFFLQKPFPPGVLLRKVREVLERGGTCLAASS